ncbi:MAG: IMP dehydrogenase [Lentisphaeria bacterium]
MVNPKIVDFMSTFKYTGLTFDDVSLKTLYSDVLPSDTTTKTRFSRNISLNVPFISAAMDTVTEHKMAIAMACLGGIGVIHKNLSPDQQAYEVMKVKHYLNGLIQKPITFNEEITISELLSVQKERRFSFSGFPILNAEGKLTGIITARDIKFENDYSKKVKDVMTKDVVTAPVGTTLEEAHRIMIEKKVGKLPLISDAGELFGLYSLHDVVMLEENVNPGFNRDNRHRLRVAAAIGPYDYERIEKLAAADVDALVVDTAHGHSKGVVDTVKFLKENYPQIDVVAGNIATKEAARCLLEAGADAVKVGIGPGSICTTRVVAGVGVPQLSAVYEVALELNGEIPVIADGGIKQSGDIAKAIAAGADTVMMGSALAGTEECPGERILQNGRSFVAYRGMGSLEAMKTGKGSRERYQQADVDTDAKLVPQGIEGLVPYRGLLENVLHQFIGGLRYSLGYVGAASIEELQAKAEFVRVSAAGLREAHPHDVKIYKEAPNYTIGQ